jgi:hypothetical protein
MVIKLVGPRLVQEQACQSFPDERGQHLARFDQHRHCGLGGDHRILVLEEVLHMRVWLAILAGRAGRRDRRESPFCQLQAATPDRNNTGIADERRQMLGEVFAQPTSRCGKGWRVGLRSSLPRQQSPQRRFQRVPNRHQYLIKLDDSSHGIWANALEPVLTDIPNSYQQDAARLDSTSGEAQLTTCREFEAEPMN